MTTQATPSFRAKLQSGIVTMGRSHSFSRQKIALAAMRLHTPSRLRIVILPATRRQVEEAIRINLFIHVIARVRPFIGQ